MRTEKRGGLVASKLGQVAVGLMIGAVAALGGFALAAITFSNPNPVAVTIAEDDAYGTTLKWKTDGSSQVAYGTSTITVDEGSTGTNSKTIYFEVSTTQSRPNDDTMDVACDGALTCSFGGVGVARGTGAQTFSVNIKWQGNDQAAGDRTGNIKATWRSNTQ